MDRTKTIASILTGLIISYLSGVASYNCWDFMFNLEPAECVINIVVLTLVALLSAGVVRILIYGFTGE